MGKGTEVAESAWPKQTAEDSMKMGAFTPISRRKTPEERIRHLVRVGVMQGDRPEDLHKLFLNPMTGEPFTLKAFQAEFAEELENGKKLLLLSVAGALTDVAMTPTPQGVKAAETLLRIQDPKRWTEPAKRVEHTGADGGVIAVENSVAVSLALVRDILGMTSDSKTQNVIEHVPD